MIKIILSSTFDEIDKSIMRRLMNKSGNTYEFVCFDETSKFVYDKVRNINYSLSVLKVDKRKLENVSPKNDPSYRQLERGHKRFANRK